MDAKKLDQLRKKLDKIDEHIIELIAERQINVDQIGTVKMLTKSPTRDYRREKQVIDHIRAHAAKHNIDQDIAQEIFTQIIKSSLTKQENQKLNNSSYGSDKSALIIGGNGKMGRWFAEFLSSQEFTIFVHDKAHLPDQQNFIADLSKVELDFDYIIIAAPIQQSALILEQLCQFQPTGIVLDISSIKSPLRLPLRKLADTGCKVVSIHPMFGPDIQLLSNKHIIFIEIGDKKAVNQVKQLFEPTMAERIDMKLEDHDRLIAYVLGLSHALNIAFLTVLAESGEAAELLAKLSSTTFDGQLDIARKVSTENPHLYYEIQKLNRYSSTTLSALNDAIQRLSQLIDSSNEDGFVKIMQQAQDYINTRP